MHAQPLRYIKYGPSVITYNVYSIGEFSDEIGLRLRNRVPSARTSLEAYCTSNLKYLTSALFLRFPWLHLLETYYLGSHLE